jgi:hypothetical protein
MGKHGIDVLIESAKKDPRMSDMMGHGEDDEDTAKPDETEDEDAGDGLDAVFSKSQADAIRAAIKAGC